MLLQVSDDGYEYLANLGLWDLDYERGIRATREPEGIQAEDHMILKLYDTQNPNSTGPKSETYFTNQVPDPNTVEAMQKTIRRLFERGLLMDSSKPDPSEMIDVVGPHGEIVPSHLQNKDRGVII